jgi:hypothetical protein
MNLAIKYVIFGVSALILVFIGLMVNSKINKKKIKYPGGVNSVKLFTSLVITGILLGILALLSMSCGNSSENFANGVLFNVSPGKKTCMELGVETGLTIGENETLRCAGGCCGKGYTGIGPYGQFPMTINSYSRDYIPCCGKDTNDYVYSDSGLCTPEQNKMMGGDTVIENYDNFDNFNKVDVNNLKMPIINVANISNCDDDSNKQPSNYYNYANYLTPGVKVEQTLAATDVFDPSGMGNLCKTCPLKNLNGNGGIGI